MDRNKILIVEDDFDTQLFLNLFLGRYYQVDICNSDSEFYSLLESNKYALIRMDIAIKGSKDGLQMTKELKSTERYKNIPIICLSAHVLDKYKKNAYEAGADIFLEKPVKNYKLLNTVKELISG